MRSLKLSYLFFSCSFCIVVHFFRLSPFFVLDSLTYILYLPVLSLPNILLPVLVIIYVLWIIIFNIILLQCTFKSVIIVRNSSTLVCSIVLCHLQILGDSDIRHLFWYPCIPIPFNSIVRLNNLSSCSTPPLLLKCYSFHSVNLSAL